jgi:hypothetical protein
MVKNTNSRSLSKNKQSMLKRKIRTTKNKIFKRRKNIKSLKKGGSKNGCVNNQRLVYDAEGIIGCSKPFGSPYQGGQKFVFPNKIKSM